MKKIICKILGHSYIITSWWNVFYYEGDGSGAKVRYSYAKNMECTRCNHIKEIK